MAQHGSGNLSTREEALKLNYLQPEILPVQVMVDVLKERGIKPAILQQAERLKIIHLFYKYVSPKYQRDCRDNRRGKLLKKKRERKAIHSKDENWKMLVVESKGKIFPNLSTKTTVNNNGERLKPPPSCINTERKIIKLGSVSKSSSTGLDFLIGKKDDSEVSEEKESNKKQKLLKEKRKTQCEEETKMKKIKVNHEENEAVLPVLTTANTHVERINNAMGQANPLCDFLAQPAIVMHYTTKKKGVEDCKTLKADRKPITWP